MKELIMESYGKINLALDVLYKRDDGYHEINSVMQQIDLKDILIFSDHESGIIIESDDKEMPLNNSNLIYKAWERLKNITGIHKGIRVRVDKKIPIAAGLAGGSSNGATTLKALNILWDLDLSLEELMAIGKPLGADIPFCIMGGTAKAQGIGEKLSKLKPFKGKYILLANPGFGITSGYAYSKLRFNDERLDIDGLITYMEEDNLELVAKQMRNIMEKPMVEEYPIIQEIKDIMLNHGALGALMSGSGATVFGLFDDEERLLFTEKKLKQNFDKVYSCLTI
ncbi:4-(cytidine 5'-diphospho)-2-C-methyl-D-erythritol kinase [Paratissierella segnis]|jgi:4-diphosphocytidyl-2-C-methyl-D-erythritol kinase|uniref:4-diphosphocytidyl-2-C-methyl-D-erythritol kinase n=1 Tax=Paratissierella segnis TaxID=2763679 RepID=A0A926IFJ4_9FIRM|nr:4-(cytidine 5'-diphospho)-2-C-methyl-D-erythritol kinase [Paratissierella segnis]MBC8588567.1 4-(cytidine 5'-diphospho)-2-C-methyl-D-erythritol kinase [Paratissierella segnis]